MTRTPPSDRGGDRRTDKDGAAASPARADRLAEALRANLRRRKAQARARAADGDRADPADRG